MLAQSFLTAAELGLDDAEHGALVKVLGMLERGELVHRIDFNMQNWCGTTCCIGGWAEKIGGLEDHSLSGKALGMDFGPELSNPQLARLFYPPVPGSDDAYDCLGEKEMVAIRPEQAAIALRSFLTTGEPCWDEAMS